MRRLLQKKRENILEKIVQKDYNNILEEVIETKNFDEDVKSLLHGILYKIDISYKDYKTVKREVESKQDYIKEFVGNIKNNCNTIKIAKLNSKEAEKLKNEKNLVDTKNKEIICYPIERKLLYSISKIGKQDLIMKKKYFIINKAMSNLINIGHSINTVEPLRDFNGWSWTTIPKEIENISYNLIYQNLNILVGVEFLENWITNTEDLIDYYQEFKEELSEKFGEKLSDKIIVALEKLSILLEIENNPEFEKDIRKFKQDNDNKLSEFENNQTYIEKLATHKIEINKQIKNIEQILSDKKLLELEYTKVNEDLPTEEKIFSMAILKKHLEAEKHKLQEDLIQKNELLNPKKFVAEKDKLEKRNELLKVVDIQEKIKEKNKILKEFQKLFLECFLKFINNAETKDEIVNLIYIFRYYNFLPFNEKLCIKEIKELKKKLLEIEQQLLKKAIDYKILADFSQNVEENIELFKFIFQTKIISLDEIYVSITEEKEKIYIELLDRNENSYEEKFELKGINKDNLNIKLNKKSKILI